MTDTNGKLNGNGNGLLREIFATKERAVAWGFRLVLGALMTVATALCWVVWGEFTRMRSAFEDNAKIVWQNLQTTDKGVAILTEKLHEEQDAISQLRTTTQDHEGRIRYLERTRQN